MHCSLFVLVAAGTLTSSPASTNGVVTVCPGDSLSLTCTHDNVMAALTRWEVNGSNVMSCQEAALHNNNPADGICGPFTIIMISDGTGPVLSSTALATVSEALDGAMVECFSGASSTAPSEGIITIQVAGERKCGFFTRDTRGRPRV